ncbi:P-loop containing nucleoside triphosphate hydrolase protein [Pelagophyceae sp. CCMP2097]|nr:P-loop containing nucleoside triphosphate hydrolase protein [Pelagophyceae sp. CCMP2097]
MDGGPWAGGRAGAGDADADDSDGGRSDDGGGGDGSAMGGGFGDAGDDGDGGPAGRSRRAGSRKRYHDAEMEAGGDDDGEDDDGADFESAKPKAWNKPWSKPFVGRVCDKCGTEAQKHARRCVCGELLSARSKANAVNPQKRRRTTNIVSRKAKAVFGGEPELDDGGQRIIDVIVARRLRPGFSHIDDVGHLDAFAFEYHLKWRQASRLKLEWVSAELISQLGKKSKGVLSRFQQKVAEEEVDEDLTCDVERIVDSRMTSVFETIEALKDEDAAMDVDASAENVAAQNGAQNGAATAPEKGNGAAHGANGGADGGALAAPAPRPPAVAAPAVEHEERALIPALLELTADGRWHVDGEHVGCWITRTCSTNKYTGEVRSSVGRVTGWLAARDSDFVDSSRSYAALWHVQYYSGDLVGDEEDLETHQVLESAPRNSSGSEDAERNWVNARPGVPSAKLAAEVLRVRRIIEYIAEDANAWMFVPPIDIEGYAEVVWPNLPTCLQGIVGDIDRGFYQSAEKVASDVRIVWANCGVYNGRDSEIALYADAFAMRFERLFLTWMRYAQVPPLPLLDAPETPACAHCDSTVCELRDGVRRCDLCRPRGERGALPFASEEEATFRRAEFAALPKREVKRLQYLVKWRSEAYDASTWEHAGELRTTFRAKIERFNALKEWAESHRDDGRSFAEAERLPAPPPSSGSFFEISVAHQEFGRISFDVRAVQPAYYIIVVGVNPPTAEQAAQALAAPPDRTEGKSSEGGGAVDQIGRLRWGDVVFELGANRLFGLPLEQLRTTLGVLHRQQQTLRMLVCRPIGHTGDLDSVLKQARQAASERQAYVARPPVREMRAPKTPLPKPRRTRNDARELRPYQQHGVNWLLTNRAEKRGCILADEMGLGKTAQVANALERDYVESGLPTMVVAPLSTIEQWRRELEAWTNLEVCVYHGVSARGSSRDLVREFEWWPFGMQQGGRRGGGVAFDVLVTTYEIVQQDAAALRSVSWGAVVVDEAHRLKRDNSRLAECIEKALSGNGHSSDVWRCLVTGTPLQNNLKEMWSLLHFCDPIGFASHKSFEVQFGNIESHGDVVQLALLKDTLKPRLLRRVKEDVAKDIPEKRETVVDVELTLTQKRLYRAIYERNALALQSASCSASALRSVQMQLRNACNHASLVHGIDASYAAAEKDSEGRDALVSGSGKFVLLEKLLPRLKAEGRKVLIFSQFVRLLDLLARLCVTRGHDFERIDGTIKMVDRQTSIDRFNDPKSNAFIFLISTRAGGVGLNLQAADTVIIFDSDWNPQNDLQAQARCHRLGQTRDVMVYRLVASRSFERTMFDRASKKLGLERAVLGAPGQSEEDADKQPSKKALQDLLKLGAFQLLTDDKVRQTARKRAGPAQRPDEQTPGNARRCPKMQMSQQFGD